MDENESKQTTGQGGSSTEAWQEVGQRFEALGNSLSAALRKAWDDEGNQQALHQMEAGLKSMAKAVADTVDQAAASPEGQQARQEAERVVASARQAGEKAVNESRPQIVAALESLRAGLQSAIEQLQGKQPPETKA